MIAKIELWALRSLAAAAVLGFVGWWIYSKGEAHVQAKWDVSEVERMGAEVTQNAKNVADTIKRQEKVVAAEAAKARAESELVAYRKSHPLSLLSCGLHSKAPGHPANPGQGTGHGSTTAGGDAGGVVQPSDPRDIGTELDEFAAKADEINSAYRVCLATRPGAP